VGAGKVDVIVRLQGRRPDPLVGDFASLVELFDQHNVSFVSVTQQFNTTTSMGRLTLNVLLSFASSSGRSPLNASGARLAASKRKGLWVGGMAPLGYDTKDRKITLNEAEAARVRTIFRSYPKLGTLNLLIADLRKRGIVTKVRHAQVGREGPAAIPFPVGRSPICFQSLYIGEVAFKGEILKGEQIPSSTAGCSMPSRPSLTRKSTATRPQGPTQEALLSGRNLR